jgi:hypothetical protein
MEQTNGKNGQTVAWLVRQQQRERKWRGHLSRWRGSGLSQAAYCRQQGLAPADFSWWKYELARRDGKLDAATKNLQPIERRESFVPIRLTPSIAEPFAFEVVLNSGETLRIRSGFDADTLKRLIATLREDSRAC